MARSQCVADMRDLARTARRAGAEQDRTLGKSQRDIFGEQRVGEIIERFEDVDGQAEVAQRGDIGVMFGAEDREIGIRTAGGADTVDCLGSGGAAEGVGEVERISHVLPYPFASSEVEMS